MITFADAQEREHCRLDLHKVQEGLFPLAAWFERYSERLAALLLEPLADEEDNSELHDDLERAEADATKAEELAEARSKAINDACALLENDPPLVADDLTVLENPE